MKFRKSGLFFIQFYQSLTVIPDKISKELCVVRAVSYQSDTSFSMGTTTDMQGEELSLKLFQIQDNSLHN